MGEKFPIVDLKGSPREVGLGHGKQLADRIKRTIDVYRKIFGRTDEEILKAAEHFRAKIKDFSQDFAEEIEAIAEGAGLDDRWIYALNARSELLTLVYHECTALYFRKSRILGQNWDWMQALEELTVIMRINGDILMITEPGIIGKIGLNSSGIGVCFNFLKTTKKLDGIPIHILLRSVLESKSFEEVQQNIKRAGLGRAGNILVGDSKGNYLDFEFHGDEVFELGNEKDIMFHTNHYIGRDITQRDNSPSSFSRYERTEEITKEIEGKNADELKSILLDKAGGDLPICKSFVESTVLGPSGTVCSIVLDLNKKEMDVTRGSPLHNKFVKIKL